jgi:hypothetical protein
MNEFIFENKLREIVGTFWALLTKKNPMVNILFKCTFKEIGSRSKISPWATVSHTSVFAYNFELNEII